MTATSCLSVPCLISRFRRGVNGAFALLGCYATQIDSYRRYVSDNLPVPTSRVKQVLGMLDP